VEKMCVILNISNFKELGNLGRIDEIKLRTYLINELLENIVETATENYNMDEGTTESPAMIVLDEAHYIVPENTSGLSGDQKRLLQHISSSVKTTRKYGVGWMFITQLITDFKKDVYKQLTNHYFLYGLQIGTDRNHVKETVGSDNIRLYEAIADPKTTGKFPVMIKGPVVGFSSMHAPIVLIGPISDSDFVRLNMYEDTQFPERFNQNKGKSIQNYQEYQAGQSGNFSIE
ncbi:MAG: DUF853 family protein, partial [Candidatus Heimdallarchaeota archaeon]|nr:DUF853 family protein [Candidatus Heimdallarchaeota archaeon]